MSIYSTMEIIYNLLEQSGYDQLTDMKWTIVFASRLDFLPILSTPLTAQGRLEAHWSRYKSFEVAGKTVYVAMKISVWLPPPEIQTKDAITA